MDFPYIQTSAKKLCIFLTILSVTLILCWWPFCPLTAFNWNNKYYYSYFYICLYLPRILVCSQTSDTAISRSTLNTCIVGWECMKQLRIIKFTQQFTVISRNPNFFFVKSLQNTVFLSVYFNMINQEDFAIKSIKYMGWKLLR